MSTPLARQTSFTGTRAQSLDVVQRASEELVGGRKEGGLTSDDQSCRRNSIDAEKRGISFPADEGGDTLLSLVLAIMPME